MLFHQSDEEAGKHNLHIMSDCIISMPISIGLEKNSPLKPRIDEFIQRVVEAGLIHKWLDDVMDEVQRSNLLSNTEQVGSTLETEYLEPWFPPLNMSDPA